MKTSNIKMLWIGHGRLQKVVPRNATPMCLTSAKPGFVQVRKRKYTSGGYAPRLTSVAGANSASDSSYNDFIHYNYGKKKQRHHGETGPGAV